MLNITIAHNEQTSVGEIRYTFSLGPPEVKALTLLMSEASDLRPEFSMLWDSVVHYESASFGLKELMSSVVNKLQKKDNLKALGHASAMII